VVLRRTLHTGIVPSPASESESASERPPSAVCDRGHALAGGVPSERRRSSVPPSSNAARLRRAGGLHSGGPAPPFLYGIAPIPDLWPRFPPSTRRDGRTAYPSSLQSEKRTQRPKLVAIAKPPLRSGFAGPSSILLPPRSARRLRRPWRCCSGPLLRPAIRRNLAVASDRHLTTSHGPRDEALRDSATPTGDSRYRCLVGGRQIRNSKFEIRNFLARGWKRSNVHASLNGDGVVPYTV